MKLYTIWCVINMPNVYKHQRYRQPIPHFFEDLQFGEGFEAKAIKYLESRKHQAWKHSDRRFDLRVNIEADIYGSIVLNAECKYDRLASSTKNLALQTWDNNKPSGIHPDGPNPDLWIHGFNQEIFIVRTSMLRSVVETHTNSWGGQVVKIGDWQTQCHGILMPIEVARKMVGSHWGVIK